MSEEEIRKLMENMVVDLVAEVFPHLKIQQKPFPILTYKESMDKHGTDKPDLRKDKNNKSELAFCWVVDFPLFVKSDTENILVSSHHPFTRPHDEDLALLDKSPEKVRSYAYDLALNGFEIGGGSLRIFNDALQKKIFKILGVSDEDVKERFGHMLEAFTYGVPPHGGIAFGLDRLIAILQGEENIREVIAFPKTGDAKDLMMGAPSQLPEESLKEAHIKIR
jgi:aspartyl-tRNA synthetase